MVHKKKRWANVNSNRVRPVLKMYVILLNNDTTVDPRFATELITAAGTNTAFGMLCSKICLFDRPDVLWYAGASFHPRFGWGRHRGYGEQDRGQYDNTEETERPTRCALMVRKALCETVGLFREEFFCYVDDVDWGMRAQNAHFKILYVPRSKVWHKVSRSTGGTSSGISHYYTIRNMLSCLDTNKPLPFLLRTLRHCSIVCTMLLSLLTQNVSKMAGIKYLYRGAVDYFYGKFGDLSYEADR